MLTTVVTTGQVLKKKEKERYLITVTAGRDIRQEGWNLMSIIAS